MDWIHTVFMHTPTIGEESLLIVTLCVCVSVCLCVGVIWCVRECCVWRGR